MNTFIITIVLAGGLSMLVGCTTPSGMHHAGQPDGGARTSGTAGVVSPAPGPEHDRQTAATVSSRGRALWTGHVALENDKQESEAGSTFRFR